MITLYLIRHGITEDNINRIIQGQRNTHLSSLGKEKIKEFALLIKDEIKIDKIYSSPLYRAYETASIIKNELHVDSNIITDDDLKERCFGVLENTKITDSVFDIIQKEDVIGLEKEKDLFERINRCVSKIISESEGKNVLIVTHYQVIRGLINIINKGSYFDGFIDNGSLNIVEYKDNKLVVKEINKHLESV